MLGIFSPTGHTWWKKNSTHHGCGWNCFVAGDGGYNGSWWLVTAMVDDSYSETCHCLLPFFLFFSRQNSVTLFSCWRFTASHRQLTSWTCLSKRPKTNSSIWGTLGRRKTLPSGKHSHQSPRTPLNYWVGFDVGFPTMISGALACL